MREDDNAYRTPGSEIELPRPAPDTGFGEFKFDRAFDLGFSAFTKNMGTNVLTFFLAFLLILAVPALGAGAVFASKPHYLYSIPIATLAVLFFFPAFMLGLPIVGLFVVRRGVEVGDIFVGFSAYWRLTGAFLLLTLISMMVQMPFTLPQYYQYFLIFQSAGSSDVGVILKALEQQSLLGYSLLSYVGAAAGMFVGARLLLTGALIVERGMGVFEAIGSSWKATAASQWWLMLFYFVSSLISGAGIIACCVGIFFSIPLAYSLQGAALFMLLGEDQAGGSDAQPSAGPGDSAPVTQQNTPPVAPEFGGTLDQAAPDDSAPGSGSNPYGG